MCFGRGSIPSLTSRRNVLVPNPKYAAAQNSRSLKKARIAAKLNVCTLARPGQRSLHAVLCEALTNARGLLVRLEAGVTEPRDQQRETVRLLYVATRHQVQALAAALELEGLE
jgi:hypothetical protein